MILIFLRKKIRVYSEKELGGTKICKKLQKNKKNATVSGKLLRTSQVFFSFSLYMEHLPVKLFALKWQKKKQKTKVACAEKEKQKTKEACAEKEKQTKENSLLV